MSTTRQGARALASEKPIQPASRATISAGGTARSDNGVPNSVTSSGSPMSQIASPATTPTAGRRPRRCAAARSASARSPGARRPSMMRSCVDPSWLEGDRAPPRRGAHDDRREARLPSPVLTGAGSRVCGCPHSQRLAALPCRVRSTYTRAGRVAHSAHAAADDARATHRPPVPAGPRAGAAGGRRAWSRSPRRCIGPPVVAAVGWLAGCSEAGCAVMGAVELEGHGRVRRRSSPASRPSRS